jgi:hypothetical protein
VTASPLVLDQVDEVAFLADGVVVRQATHRALLAGGDAVAAAYRRVVSRASGEGVDTGGTPVVPARLATPRSPVGAGRTETERPETERPEEEVA